MKFLVHLELFLIGNSQNRSRNTKKKELEKVETTCWLEQFNYAQLSFDELGNLFYQMLDHNDMMSLHFI